MKNYLKNLGSKMVLGAFFVGLIIVGSVSAFGADLIPSISGGSVTDAVPPGNLAASTTNSATVSTFDLRRVQNLPLQVSFATQAATTNTSGLSFSLYRSIDGTTYETTAWATYTLAATSTNTAVGFTNINCAGVPFLKLATWVNANSAQALTNITVRVRPKPETLMNLELPL